MAVAGTYRVNFTDPKKGSFIIEPYTVNGTVTATSKTLHPKATRANTSLVLYGQYVPNYGEGTAESLLHLLENFCGETQPTNAVEGQFWYDTGDSFNIIGLSPTGATIEGNHSARFGQLAAMGTVMTVWYGPLNNTNNSYEALDVKVSGASVNMDGTTNVIFVSTENGVINLPATAVGGFVTVKQESGLGRMRIRVKNPSGQLVWADAVNVVCSPTAPAAETRMTGDVWYDTSTAANGLFKVFLNNTWVEVTKNHLPLAGGTMAGPIAMGTHSITYTGPVSSGTTLTPKSYVDTSIATAITNAMAGSNSAILDLQQRVGVIETTLPDKLDKDGGNIRNALVFGDDGSVSAVVRGIDMKSLPIVNPQITWNATDYLTAATQGNYVPSKDYVARALRQHLLDVKHVEKGFILEQIDGRGLIPGSIYFTADHSLTWERNTTQYSAFVRDNSFVISTGSNALDVIELRHGSQPVQLTDPAFSVGADSVQSYKTLYLFDGQPQPNFGGGLTDKNDDTAVATKGFVHSAVAEGTSGILPVTGGSFAYNGAANTYTLNLTRFGASNVAVDMYHTHSSSTLSYMYEDLAPWAGGETDKVMEAIEAIGIDLMAVPISIMLTEVNRWKAPIQGARFLDLPKIGSSFDVVDVDVAGNRFELSAMPTTIVPGLPVVLAQWEAALTFTALNVYEEVDMTNPDDPWTRYWLDVQEPVPTDHDPLVNMWKIEYGWFAEPTEGEAVVTRTTLDYELNKKQNTIPTGTTAQFYRGDKNWATLNAAAVGLGNVNNTSDANKPISTATQTALNGKRDIATYTSVSVNSPFTLAQNGQFIETTNAASIQLTIPAGLPDNWEVEVMQGGAGDVQIVAGVGVTLRSPNGARIKGQYSVVKIKKLGSTDTFVLYLDTRV